MTHPVILVDVNGLGYATQAAQMKARLSSGPIETTAVYGVLRQLQAIREQFRGQLMVLWDGRSWRYQAYPDYKGNRGNDPKLVAIGDAWRPQRKLVGRLLPLIGVHQALASNLEADDLAARLRRSYRDRGHEVVLVTGDKDWLQLLEPGVIAYDPVRTRLTTPDNFADVTGLPTPYSMAEFKALQGDVSDNIKGVGGVGAKTAQTILNRFGTVAGFVNAMMGDPGERETMDWRALSLMDPERQDAFRRNMALIHLDHPGIPKPEGLKIIKGAVDQEGLQAFLEEHAFHSVLRDFDKCVQVFSRKDN